MLFVMVQEAKKSSQVLSCCKKGKLECHRKKVRATTIFFWSSRSHSTGMRTSQPIPRRTTREIQTLFWQRPFLDAILSVIYCWSVPFLPLSEHSIPVPWPSDRWSTLRFFVSSHDTFQSRNIDLPVTNRFLISYFPALQCFSF